MNSEVQTMKNKQFKQDKTSHVDLSKHPENLHYGYLSDKLGVGTNTLSKEEDKKLSIFFGVCIVCLIAMIIMVPVLLLK